MMGQGYLFGGPNEVHFLVSHSTCVDAHFPVGPPDEGSNTHMLERQVLPILFETAEGFTMLLLNSWIQGQILTTNPFLLLPQYRIEAK